jgi:hypothetical protein
MADRTADGLAVTRNRSPPPPVREPSQLVTVRVPAVRVALEKVRTLPLSPAAPNWNMRRGTLLLTANMRRGTLLLTQVAHFADSIGLGDSAKADSVQKSSLHFTASTLLGRFGCRGVCRWRRRLDIRHQPLGNIELEGGQQLRLLGVGSGHPA